MVLKVFIKRVRILVFMLATFIMMANPSFAAVFNLVAQESEVTMPDTTVIPMWGFALDTGQSCIPGTVPVWDVGPDLIVQSGDTALTINLRNCLSEEVSIVISGQAAVLNPVTFTDGQGRTRVKSFTTETPADGTTVVPYNWTGLKPGTFLYQSGTHPGKQVQMGLYGAVKVDDGTYPGASFDNEVMILYSEIDPALHAPTPTGAKPLNYKPAYFLVNGQPFLAGQTPLSAGSANQTLLIRFLNAGLKPHVAALQNGGDMSVRAEDGNLYPFPREQYSVFLPPGKTADVLWTPTAEGTYAIYDRSLHLTSAGVTDGGMYAELLVGSVPGAPTADAGPDQTDVLVRVFVTLDGNGSTDNGVPGPLTYLWSFIGVPGGSTAALSDPTVVDPTFTPDVAGNYVVQLVVNDGASDSAPDIVNITTQLPPVADAGPDQAVTVGDTVNLNGINSMDPDGIPGLLTYSWSLVSQPAGSAAVLSDPTAVNPTFPADVAGDYVAELVVSDGNLDSDPDTVIITASAAGNIPPVAVDDVATTVRNVPVTIDVVFNDTDADGNIEPATVCTNAADCAVTTTISTRGGIVENQLNGTVIFTPKRNFRGTDTFTYAVSDNDGATSNVATVRVNVVRP